MEGSGLGSAICRVLAESGRVQADLELLKKKAAEASSSALFLTGPRSLAQAELLQSEVKRMKAWASDVSRSKASR